jgi:hypothetical protein
MSLLSIRKEGNWKWYSDTKWGAIWKKFGEEWTPIILEELRKGSPKSKSGRLRSSLFGTFNAKPHSLVMTFASHGALDNKGRDYFPWVVWEGTPPHDIPGAFGRDLPFGIGGRFNGKFHPGIEEPDRFPIKVWATMEIAVSASLARAIKQEFTL